MRYRNREQKIKDTVAQMESLLSEQRMHLQRAEELGVKLRRAEVELSEHHLLKDIRDGKAVLLDTETLCPLNVAVVEC